MCLHLQYNRFSCTVLMRSQKSHRRLSRVREICEYTAARQATTPHAARWARAHRTYKIAHKCYSGPQNWREVSARPAQGSGP